MAAWKDDWSLHRFRSLTSLTDEFSDSSVDARGRWIPAVDTYEIEEGLVLLVELAGVSPDEITLTIEERTLTLSGCRPEPGGECKVRLHRMEIDYGPFERKILLPQGIDPGGIEAKYRDGFLRIVIPHSPARGEQSITIREE